MKELNSIGQMFLQTSERNPSRPAFAQKRNGKTYETITYGQWMNEAQEVAAGLMDLGVSKGDRIGLFADNRYEWILMSAGITLAGAADVPRGTDITHDEMQYIVNHSGAKVVVVENRYTLDKVRGSGLELSNLQIVCLTDGVVEEGGGLLTLNSLKKRGQDYARRFPKAVQERMQSLESRDLYSLIYTSGTTGNPKGVMLSHGNLLSQIQGLPFSIDPSERILSILPVWHIFERAFELMTIACGACTYYSTVRSLREDLAVVRPTFMASAPRLWESIYSGILTNVAKASSLRKGMFRAALFFAGAFRGSLRRIRRRNLRLRPDYFYFLRLPLDILRATVTALPAWLLDRLVLSKIRKATGGALRGSVSGGGALPLHVDEFFNNIGIPVLEGYGLTETSPVLAVRTFSHLVPGTVGPIYSGTEIRIKDLNTGEILFTNEGNPGGSKPPGGVLSPSAENRSVRSRRIGVKGEIHVRGPQVTSGYYRDPLATEKVLVQGWFNTGDLGMMTANGCLKIVGRSKETIVLLGGENVEPGPIENRLLQSALIHQCMVVGQDRKYLAALVVPEAAAFSDISDNLPEISASEEAKSRILKEIKSLVNDSSGFKSFERVVDVALLPRAFEQGDELTAKLSVKRHVVLEKYESLIDSLYSARSADGKKAEGRKKAVAH